MTLVLIVDDSPMDRTLACGLLKKQSHCDVVFADNGEAGVQAIRELKPDLVLTDMQMPVMNGLEMVVQAGKEEFETPIVLMTATGSEELAVEALRLGASSYVPKRSLAKRLVSTARMVLAAANEGRQHNLLLGRLEFQSESFHLQSSVVECSAMSRYLQSSLTRIWHLNATWRMRVGLVLDEALLNALYHGNLEISSELKNLSDNSFEDLAKRRQTELPYCSRQIGVQFFATAEETRFVIRDQGKGFDVAHLPDPTDATNITRPSGRGVMLMRTFMNQVLFNERGNEVTLILKKPKDDGILRTTPDRLTVRP